MYSTNVVLVRKRRAARGGRGHCVDVCGTLAAIGIVALLTAVAYVVAKWAI